MKSFFETTCIPLAVAGTFLCLWMASVHAQEERPTKGVWKKWQRDITQFETELRKLVKEAEVPGLKSLEKRMEEESGGLEVITDGGGGFVDFNATKGTVQFEATERFAGMNLVWEFVLAKDTEIFWNKSTILVPKTTAKDKGEKQEGAAPFLGITIQKATAGPFEAGSRVRLKASIDDFSRFRKDFSRATGLVAVYYLEESPTPAFMLLLDEAEVTLIDPEAEESAP